ncbi:MAG: DUF1189 domain-containing protein [Lentisphaeraceae bacterium]|nr:DUF1189 domain-containing protein [Lentisphaeraceae bacterium]
MNKKISLAQVITKCYSRDVMRHVGQNWRGNGLLLLLGVVVYVSLFAGYSWSSYIKSTYKEVYAPAIPLLPTAHYKDGKFSFDVEQPYIVKHPITKKPIFYIDTNEEDFMEISNQAPCVIYKDGVLVTNLSLPPAPLGHQDIYNFCFLIYKKNDGNDPSIFALFKQSIHLEDTVSPNELLKNLNSTFDNLFPFSVASLSVMIFVQEFLKVLIISVIILLMMKNGGKSRNFSQLMRLCVLAYLPSLFIDGILKFFLQPPGMLTIIILSVMHIGFFMKAIAVNSDPIEIKPKHTDF